MDVQIERRYAPLELRADGRGLSGVVMPYAAVAALPWGCERFEAGAFGDVSAIDCVLNVQHDRARPIARSQGGGLILDDSTTALTMRAELLDTRDGADAMLNVKGKILRGLSVEFMATRERMVGDLRIVEGAELRGIGLVDRPTYDMATVAARAALDRMSAPRRRYWL